MRLISTGSVSEPLLSACFVTITIKGASFDPAVTHSPNRHSTVLGVPNQGYTLVVENFQANPEQHCSAKMFEKASKNEQSRQSPPAYEL